MSSSEIKKSNVNIWEWLPLFISPFFFGLICKVFPIDNNKVLLFAVVFFLCYFLFALFIEFIACLSPIMIGISFILYVCSTPFWAMTFTNNKTTIVPEKFAISFNDAHADPAEFSQWWNFFVNEVVKTNKIIFELDKTGKPDGQGIYPFKAIPNTHATFYQGQISINKYGYRGADFTTPKKNTYRILAIGDSVTFGQSLFSDSRPWPAALQTLINNKLKCKQKIEVVNGGINGFHLMNSIDQIERDHYLVDPDMVLSYVGWNSMADLGIYPPTITLAAINLPNEHDHLSRVKWYASKAFVTFINEEMTSLNNNIFSLVKKQKSNKQLLNIAQHGLLFRNYQQLIAQSRRLHFQLVLLSVNTAVTPQSPEFAKNFYEEPWPGLRSIIKQVEIHNEMIQAIANKEKDVLYIDTSNGLKGNYDSDKFIDIVHFSTVGDQRLAENIFQKIRSLLLNNDKLQCHPVL